MKDDPMDEIRRRAMHDQHSRDEARARREQQEAAGGQHEAVQPYPEHGAESQHATDRGSMAGLARSYGEARQAEDAAWRQVASLREEEWATGPAWQVWRSAVEARDEATRRLINSALSQRE